MAYRKRFGLKRRYGKRKSFGRKTRLAGKVAKRKARAAYKTAIRLPKRRLAKIYATKVGQVTFKTVASKKRGRRFGKKRYNRRY